MHTLSYFRTTELHNISRSLLSQDIFRSGKSLPSDDPRLEAREHCLVVEVGDLFPFVIFCPAPWVEVQA